MSNVAALRGRVGGLLDFSNLAPTAFVNCLHMQNVGGGGGFVKNLHTRSQIVTIVTLRFDHAGLLQLQFHNS